MVLYHPAFLLRDPRRKRDMWEHAQKLKAWLEAQARVRSASGGAGGTTA
jgi:uracil-DNA glycosylase